MVVEDYAEVLSSIAERRWSSLRSMICSASNPMSPAIVGDRRRSNDFATSSRKIPASRFITGCDHFSSVEGVPSGSMRHCPRSTMAFVCSERSVSITERELFEDPSLQHPGLTYGWNA